MKSPRLICQAGLGLVLSGLTLQAAEKPNVLFIAIDDLVTTLGAYDDPHAITPAMDRLAEQGTTFRNHHCQWPVCGPSRAALTTSLLPEETGVMGFKPIRGQLPDVITLPQHFKNNGYETAATGKFHDPRTVGTVVDPNSKTEDGRDIDDPLSWSIPYVRADFGYNPPGKPAVDASDLPDEDYVDYKILEAGRQLLDTLETGDKPFFLAVGFKKPHLGFYAPKRHWDLYDRDQFEPASFQENPRGASSYVNGMLDNNSELLGYEPYDVTGLPTPEQEKELIHGYYACVSFIDTLVDKLLDLLATKNDPLHPDKKMSETTIVVIWGDHGFHLGDHGKWAKHSIMERSSAAPLVIYDPRHPANGVQNFHPANSIDIYPTLCELAALPIPQQPVNETVTTGRPIRGRSLVPMLHDPEARVHTGAITYIRRSGNIGYAYRTDRYRYMEWINNSNVVQVRELYDYKLDPLEKQNVITKPGNAAIAWQLSRAVRADTTTQGASRLQDSEPIEASGEEIELGKGYLPEVEIEAADPEAPSPSVTLSWPAARGVTYDVVVSHTLAGESWTTALAGITGPRLNWGLENTREFFRVKTGTNQPPLFITDPIIAPRGYAGQAYSGTLVDSVTEDASPGELVFNKLSGPDWLSLEPDGTLAGTPGHSGEGASYFRVRVVDAQGASDTAALCLQILSQTL